MVDIWQWQEQGDYDEWINELLERAPETYDDDAAAEAIITQYVRDLETGVRWLLDHMAVSETDDGFKVSWPLKGWQDAPGDLDRLLRGYVEATHA